MLIQQAHELIQKDFEATNQLIIEQLTSDVPLIQSIASHIIKSGGKRLRPTLLLLAANALNIQGIEHHELAAVVEFIHTATLLHDDVVDNSALRRGKTTANEMWGNKASILVGDFLYSRAFQILAKRENIPVMKILAHTTNALSEGEVMQLVTQNQLDLTETTYLQVIERKTASLFSASSQIGAILATQNQQAQHDFGQYGYQLGMAFQISDDCIDYVSNTNIAGKNIGDDFKEGKVTLPLIYAFRHGEKALCETVKTALKNQDPTQLPLTLQLLKETQAIEYCKSLATQYAEAAKKALESYQDNKYINALCKLADFSVNRLV